MVPPPIWHPLFLSSYSSVYPREIEIDTFSTPFFCVEVSFSKDVTILNSRSWIRPFFFCLPLDKRRIFALCPLRWSSALNLYPLGHFEIFKLSVTSFLYADVFLIPELVSLSTVNFFSSGVFSNKGSSSISFSAVHEFSFFLWHNSGRRYGSPLFTKVNPLFFFWISVFHYGPIFYHADHSFSIGGLSSYCRPLTAPFKNAPFFFTPRLKPPAEPFPPHRQKTFRCLLFYAVNCTEAHFEMLALLNPPQKFTFRKKPFLSF